MPAPIPVEVADITAAWLESVLANHAPGARLAAVDVVESHSGTTGRARVTLTHDDERLPQSVFVKLAPFDADRRTFVDETGMGIAEARFYVEIAADVPVRHPYPWYAALDEAGRYVMVLEDLQAAGAHFPGQRDPDLPGFVERTIDALADMHAAFWESPRFSIDGDLEWVVNRSQSYGSAAALVGFAVERLGTDVPEASRLLADVYLPRAERVPALLARGPRTLVHGDTHLGNMFADGATPGLLDWAMCGFGSGLRDVAYFLGGSVPIDLRRGKNIALSRPTARDWPTAAYPSMSRTHGTIPAALLTAWIAAVVTAGMDRSPADELGMAATMRADAAIGDHDVAGLLTTQLP